MQKKVKLDQFLIPDIKISSKWIKDLNIRSDSLKFLKGNISSKLFDISLSKYLFGYVSGKGNNSKNKQMGLHLSKKFLQSKEIVTKIASLLNGGKYFPIFSKRLISKYIGNSYNLTSKQPNLKMSRGLEQTFLQGEHTDGQQAYEKMLNITSHPGNAG